MSRLLSVLAAASSASLLLLTGCGAATSFSNPTASTKVIGKVFGGQQPITGSTISVWAVGLNGYGSAPFLLAETTSLDDGSFSFPDDAYSCVAGEEVYLTAAGGNTSPDYANPNIMLAVGLGDCASAKNASVEINEVSTVATAFALAQFFTLNIGGTGGFGTAAADRPAFTLSNESTIPMLVDIATGTVQPNTPGLTIEAAKIYTIANILAACVNDAADFSNCNTLFQNTIPARSGAQAPVDTLQAAVQMALYPYQNVQALYQLAGSKPPFVGLATQPNDFTIGVAYISSAHALSIVGSPTSSDPAAPLSATSASMDIDSTGRVWFPTNLSGNTGFAYFDPASMTFNGPYDGDQGYLTQPQYLAISTTGLVYVTDVLSTLLSGTLTSDPEGETYFTNLGLFLSDGPVAGDGFGNMFFAYVDDSGQAGIVEGPTAHATVTYPGLIDNPATGLLASASDDETSANYFVITSGNLTACDEDSVSDPGGQEYLRMWSPTPCSSGGIVFGPLGRDYVATTTSLNGIISSLVTVGNVFPDVLNLPEGIAVDGYANEWIANSGNGSVAILGPDSEKYPIISPVAYLHDATHGNTMTMPYAIAIDGSGNVWVANAGCVTSTATACTPGPFVLSELIGAAGPSITPLSMQMVDDVSYVGVRPGTGSYVSPDMQSADASSSKHSGYRPGSVPGTRH